MSAMHPQPDEQFALEVEPERDVVRVCPRGAVDLATADTIRATIDDLIEVGFTRVALDLRGVTFLDSSGLRLLLELTMAASADGWQLGVLEGSPDVQRVFDLAGVRALVPFVEPARLHYPRWEQAWR